MSNPPRTLEDRRASGEVLDRLPLVVGGRPSRDEMATPPAGLDKYARAAWREVCGLLVEAKLIDRVDRQQLEGYCMQVGRARAIREEIEWEHEGPAYDMDRRLTNPKTVGRRVRRRSLHEQLVAKTTRGTSANPLLAHEREAWKEARLLAEGLGLSPVGRTKLVGKRPERHGLAGLTAGLPRPTLHAVGE